MISAGRCNNSDGGGGRVTVVMSKDCRLVNGGGGYVNHCEQALGDKNEMVVAASKIIVGDDDNDDDDHHHHHHHHHHHQHHHRNHQSTVAATGRVYSVASSEIDTLKEFTLSNFDLIKELKVCLLKKDEKIAELAKEVDYLKQKLQEANQHLAEIEAREESIDVLPFTPVSSTCSSGMGDLSSAELHEQQDVVKPKKRRNRQAAIKQPNSLDPSEPVQTKRQRTRSNRAKSSDIGKMQELSLITADNAYYTCLGNYDPIKDDPVPENSNSNLEIPSWRVKTYSSWYSMEGTENMSDDIFENRHSRLELWERKRKRWDMQRIRELRRIEYLKEGRNRHHSQNTNDDDKEELTTLLPNLADIKAIEITDNLPVSAFGSNLHIKKKIELYKFYHSQWCNDGSQVPQEQRNVRGLRSSGRSQIYDTT